MNVKKHAKNVLPSANPIQKVLDFIKTRWYICSIIAIVLLAAILRFYNYSNRWGLASDQARDALIARVALQNYSLPLTGPFSSAGNFTTGPIWYWVLILATALYPNAVITPWVLLTISYVVAVLIMMRIGHELGGPKSAIIAGLLTATSPAHIAQSLNLTNPSGVALPASLALLFALRYVKNRSYAASFFLSFFIGLAIEFHYQALNLLFLLLISFMLRKPTLKHLIMAGIGLIIALLPLIYFDLIANFYNFRGITDYYLYGQYKIYVPNRWLTYLFTFWPHLLGFISGGYTIIGYLLGLFTGISLARAGFAKRLTKEIVAISVSLLCIIIALRYYRGERFDAYFIFLHPLVLTVISWTLLKTFERSKGLAIGILVILITGNIVSLKNDLLNSYNFSSVNAQEWTRYFSNNYTGEKIALYTPNPFDAGFHYPLVLYLTKENMVSPTGKKIGLGDPAKEEMIHHTSILNKQGQPSGYWILNESSTSAELSERGWGPINASDLYKSTVEWFND